MNRQVIDAAKRQDIKAILKYLEEDSDDKDVISPQELFKLMYPSYISNLPLLYTRPEEFILVPYMEIDRKKDVGFSMDREMLRSLTKTISRCEKVTSKFKGSERWIHWIQIVYMNSKNIYEAHELGSFIHRKKQNHRFAFETVQKYLNGNVLNTQDSRSMSDILFIIPDLEGKPYSTVSIECFVCSDISKNKCSKCNIGICSSLCLNKHICV